MVLCAAGVTSASAQKFSKKIQERQEARAANYFYGASFTLAAGYVHSWLSTADVAVSSLSYGQSVSARNTREAFDIGFVYDQSFSRHIGLQTGIYYVEKGGELWTFYDGGLGYGNIKRDSETLRTRAVELQALARGFVPTSRTSRVSVNAGFALSRIIKSDGDFGKWDMAPVVGLGFDWQHVAASVNYQPGIYTHLYTHSQTKMSAVYVNIGYRFWKE